MRRFAPLLVFLALAALLASALLEKPRQNILSLSGSVIHEPLPELMLATRDGKLQKLDTNGTVTLINFFASWCTACVEDHAELLQLTRNYPQLAVEGIAWNDTVSSAEEWLTRRRNPFTRVWFDTRGRATIALGLRGLPESFIVDRHGILRYHLPGPLTAELRREVVEPLIRALMEEP